MDIYFDNKALLKSPSAQLQKVGELCEGGHCTLHALGGTIIYSVDRSKTDTNEYSVEVLTIIPKNISGLVIGDVKSSYKWKIGDEVGVASHVVLRYPSGGILLTSSGHWVELVKVDVSMDNLLKVAQTNYGTEKMEEMKINLSNLQDKPEQQNQMMNMYAQQFIQQSAPSQYSSNNYF